MGLGWEAEHFTGLQMGCLTNPAVLSLPASREESLPHYRASITHPRGSTELKEIFYDPTLRYVLLKAEHRPPLPHSSDQRLCCFFFLLPSFHCSCCCFRSSQFALVAEQGSLNLEEMGQLGLSGEAPFPNCLGMWSCDAELRNGGGKSGDKCRLQGGVEVFEV